MIIENLTGGSVANIDMVLLFVVLLWLLSQITVRIIRGLNSKKGGGVDLKKDCGVGKWGFMRFFSFSFFWIFIGLYFSIQYSKHTYVCVYINMHVNLHSYMYAHIIRILTLNFHTYMYTCIHSYLHSFIHTYVLHAYIRAYLDVYTIAKYCVLPTPHSH
jgi:hypothetical protein